MKRSVFVFVFLFAAMIAVSGDADAQRKLPDTVQQAPKPAADLFQRFRYRMAFSASSAHVAGFQEVAVKSEGSGTAAPRRKITGMNKSTDVTMKRGVVHMDASFNQWVNQAKAQTKPQIKDVVIDSFDEAGRKNSIMHLEGCVVAEYQGMPDLDGPANSATIQFMKLHCASMKLSLL